jgi:hypothetical protein
MERNRRRRRAAVRIGHACIASTPQAIRCLPSPTAATDVAGTGHEGVILHATGRRVQSGPEVTFGAAPVLDQKHRAERRTASDFVVGKGPVCLRRRMSTMPRSGPLDQRAR